MTVRISPFRAALHFPAAAQLQPQQRRLFHNSPICRDDIENKTHYEILQVQPSAPPGDIKKSFYALSKAHHPDHNQHDPAAGKRFMRISEAYGVLSSAERRAKYDRDVLRLHERSAHNYYHGNGHHNVHHHRGSYSSTGPAGGRPASGLSRRRGTFHGPPPSFYRNGGWGAHSAKRSQAHEESTNGNGRGSHGDRTHHHHHQQQHWSFAGAGAGSATFGGGMGPGQDPFGRGSAAPGDMPHFDRAAQAAHTRTQARSDQRRATRLAREYHFPGTGDWGESGSFFAVLGVLGVASGVTYFVSRRWNTAIAGKREKRKKDWNGTVTG